MNGHVENNEGESKTLRLMLRKRYLLALSLIAFVILAGEVYVQDQLSAQRSDGHFINLAGLQRMRSARLAELASELEVSSMRGEKTEPAEINAVLNEMLIEHESLSGTDLSKNESIIDHAPPREVFRSVDEGIKALVAALEPVPGLLTTAMMPEGREELRAQISRVKESQRAYLAAQMEFVETLDQQGERRVEYVRRVEWMRAILVFLVLLVEAFWIFRPADRSLGKFLDEQHRARSVIEAQAKNVSKINRELEDTLLRVLDGSSPICANCKSIRQDDGTWKSIEEVLSAKSRARLSHGVCEPCAALLYPEIDLSSSGSGHGTQSDV